MQIARYVNVTVWFYLWASDILNPVATNGDFWTEKAEQALRLNQNIDDPARLLGNAVIPFVLWLAIDLFLRWLQRWDRPPRRPYGIGSTVPFQRIALPPTVPFDRSR